MQVAILIDALGVQEASLAERLCGKPEIGQELAAMRAGIDKLDLNISPMEAEFEARISQLDSKNDGKFSPLDAKLDFQCELLDMKIDTTSADLGAELVRWAVSAGILPTGLIAALLVQFVH